MQTAPIPSPSASLTPPTQGARTSHGAPDAPAFNQILSREVANQPTEKTRAAEGRPGKGEPKLKEAENSGSTQSDAAAQAAPPEPNAADASHVPAELLALVANIAQLQDKPAATKDTGFASDDSLPADLNASHDGKRPTPFGALQADFASRLVATQEDAGSPPLERYGMPRLTAQDGDARLLPLERNSRPGLESGKTDTTLALQAGATAANAGAKPHEQVDEFAAALKEVGQPGGIAPAQNALQATESLAAKAGERLAPRVGSPNWDQALGQRIVWMVQGEQQTASLTLNPPELGPLKVVLQVTNAQANAAFVAAQPEVRQALEAAMPRLRDMLSEAGIQLGQATVDSGGAQQKDASEREAGRSHGLAAGGAVAAEEAALSSVARPGAGGQGLVDTFA